MKTCPFCTTPVEDDSFFCDQCGKELKVCFECGTFVRGKFCSSCRSTNIGFAKEKAGKMNQKNSSSPEKQSGKNDCTLAGIEKEITLSLQASEGIYTIGRKEGAFVSHFCNDNFISRRHAILTFDAREECWTLSDPGSTNGTFVNGVRLAPDKSVRLKQGDIVRFAFINFKFL